MATYIEIQIKDYEREALVYSYLYYVRILNPDPSSQHSFIASSKSHHWALTCSLNTVLSSLSGQHSQQGPDNSIMKVKEMLYAAALPVRRKGIQPCQDP